MAEFRAQTPVPACWRFLFAALVSFAFFAAALCFFRPEKTSTPELPGTGSDMPDAKLRLQTAAMAFAPGKLDPRIAILTDRPDVYAPGDGPVREFGPLTEPVLFFFPPSNPVTPIRVYIDVLENSEDAFDMILLDMRFPERIDSPRINFWSSVTMALLKRTALNPFGIFAVDLPMDRPDMAACIMVAMRKVFGNAGTFCFGDRIVAVSAKSPDGNAAASYSIDNMDSLAEVAGYYSTGAVPGNAIALVLSRDYSAMPPARLLEDSYRIKTMSGQEFGAADYLRAALLSRLRERIPAGLPYGAICAWASGILLFAYLLMRYFISWKPVHKQAFLAFEDMFYLTGCCALCLLLLPDFFVKGRMTSWSPENLAQWPLLFAATGGLFAGLFLDRVLDPFFAGIGLKRKKQDRPRPGRTGKFIRFAAALFVCLAFTFAVSTDSGFSQSLPANTSFLIIVYALKVHLPLFLLFCAVAPLVARHMKEPVQSGAEIPAAFVLGTVLALVAFAVSFCFPAGPAVFAGTVCGFRVFHQDN